MLQAHILGAMADVLVFFDKVSLQYAFKASVTGLNLQDMMQAAGYNVNLGELLNALMHQLGRLMRFRGFTHLVEWCMGMSPSPCWLPIAVSISA